MPPTKKIQAPVSNADEVNNVWGQQAATVLEPFRHTLPSGQTAILKKMGIEGLIESGLLTNFDTLTQLVQTDTLIPAQDELQGHRTKKLTKAQQAAREAEEQEVLLRKVMEKPELMTSMVVIADRVTVACTVEPRVYLHYDVNDPDRTPLRADRREPGRIYTDMIDFMDKIEIMTVCVEDLDRLAQFRS